MALQKVYQKKENKEQGQAIGRATRDVKPPVVTFKEEEDDCDEKLASSRWQRMPVSRPSSWFHKIPLKINHQFRNIPMKHILGTDSAVAPATVLARHNRANALMMKHYFRSNANITSKPMKEVRSRDSSGIATISDYDWVVPTSVKQCQDTIIKLRKVTGASGRMTSLTSPCTRCSTITTGVRMLTTNRTESGL